MSTAAEHDTDQADRDERLGDAIEAYLALAEKGLPPDPSRFADDHPDIREDLKAALDGLELVRGLVGSASGPGPGHGLETGRRVAGYKIVRELGRGGMGVVYEAVHVDLDRPVALKVLGTSAAPDSSGRRRFLNEAKTAAALHHTHIVPVFDVGQVGGLCYYAMQRIEGSGLDRVIKHLRRDRSSAAGSNPPVRSLKTLSVETQGRSGGSTATWGGALSIGAAPGGAGAAGLERLPSKLADDDELPPFIPPRGWAYYRWVAEMGRQAAEALAHAHDRMVIHRDVKPSNLLVDARGMIWMADFGLARRLADPSQTQGDSLLGTPRYMSPEQAKSGPIDGRTDVYSLGATLYELLTLRPPFDGQTAAELIDQITHKEPPPPRQFDRKLPRDLETIVIKALAKRPADRYASAQEFADDLSRFLGLEPVKARRISPLGRAWRVARRHPSVTIVSTVAIVAVVGAWTTAYYRVVQDRDDAVQARRLAQDAAIKFEAADRATREVLRTQLLQQAQVQRLSNVADRRSSGLALLKQAAELEPSPEFKMKLRDEAMALLSLRDVVAGPTIPVERLSGMTPIDETRFAVLTDGDAGPTFQLWDVVKSEPLGTPHDLSPARAESPRPDFGGGPGGRGRGPSRGFGFGPGRAWSRVVSLGTRAAVLWPNGRGLRFFDAQSGEILGDLELEGRTVVGLHPVPGNAKRLVTIERQTLLDPTPSEPGDRDRNRGMRFSYRVNLWNVDRPKEPLATLAVSRPDPVPTATNGPGPGPGFPSMSLPPLVSVSPGGAKMAVAWLFDTEITLFDRDGRPTGTIDAQAPVTAIAIGPNDIVALAANGGIQIWEPDAKAPRSSLPSHQSYLSHLRFSPDNRGLLAAAGIGFGSGVEVWDLTTPALMAILPVRDSVVDLAFTPGGGSLIVGRPDSMSVWSVMDPAAQLRVAAPGRLPRVEFGTGGRLMMSSIEEGPKIWKTGDCAISGGEDLKLSAAATTFGPKGRVVAIDDAKISWVDPATRKVEAVAKLPVAGGPMRPILGGAIAQTPSGDFLAFNRLNEVLAWSASAPERVRRIELFDGEARQGPGRAPGRGGQGGFQAGWSAIGVAPDASCLYLLSRSDFRSRNEFRVYDLEEPGVGVRAVRRSWRTPVEGFYTTMAVSPVGDRAALGERSGRVVVVSTRTGAVLDRLERPEGDGDQQVFALAYSPDGAELAVGTREHVRLWSMDGPGRPTPLVRLDGHRGMIASLSFDPDGRRLASAGMDDKLVKIWDLRQIRRELAKLGLGWGGGRP